MDSDDDPKYTLQIDELLSTAPLLNHLQQLREFEADEEDGDDEAFLALELTDEKMTHRKKKKRTSLKR